MERIAEDVRAEQQTAQLASLLGGKPEWPTLESALREFESAMSAAPVRVDPEELELRTALGLRGPGG